MKIFLGIITFISVLTFSACNAHMHQCNDECDTEIESKRVELSDLDSNIKKANLKARKINHYIKKRLEDLRSLYLSEGDSKNKGLKENDLSAQDLTIPSDAEGLKAAEEDIEKETDYDDEIYSDIEEYDYVHCCEDHCNSNIE